jgi:beta-lactamase regulating signal transducer with metallopeptidase domain
MKMSLIVLAALAVSMMLRKRSAALRHWVLAAGVACAAASPILTSIVPAWTLPLGTPAHFSAYDAAAGAGTPGVATRQETTGAGVSSQPARSAAVAAGQAFSARDLWPVLRTGGIAISLAILLVGILRLAWVATRARELTTGRWVDLTTEISGIYGLRRRVTILQSDHPSLLVTWGLARPKVILPSSADEWSDDRARVVMSHELAHIVRGDWIVQLSAELLRAFYWFNPLMWIACRRLRLESEHACDDEVMSRGVEGSEYAGHLIELARALNRHRYTWYPAPAMARPSSLERRVRAMLNTGLDRGPLTRAARALIFVLLLGITAAVAAAQSGLFSFTGRIADEQGRDVSGVKVMLANEVRQAKYEVKTGESGRFEFVGLPPGDYALEAQGIGFQSVKDMLAISGQNVQRSYTLKLGRLQETINIRWSPNDPPGPGPSDTPRVVAEVPMPARKECVATAEGGRIVPPKKIRDAHPYYPTALRGTTPVATVELEALIGADGYVADVRLMGDAQPDLAQSAMAAVREWRYTETLLNCKPVEVMMTVTVNFNQPSTQKPGSNRP